MKMSDGNIEDETRTPKEPGVQPEYGYVSSMEIIDELIGQYSTVLNVVKNYKPGTTGTSTIGLNKPPV